MLDLSTAYRMKLRHKGTTFIYKEGEIILGKLRKVLNAVEAQLEFSASNSELSSHISNYKWPQCDNVFVLCINGISTRITYTLRIRLVHFEITTSIKLFVLFSHLVPRSASPFVLMQPGKSVARPFGLVENAACFPLRWLR